ncbi:hypothetical protein GCM10011391_27870 [Pullulanibacillus camelliae]|uniref:Uncharacterized protein n=1 Tax=Pullulanibacillus camelliae TaxID=1707096 RepID=A0A8J3DX32_9BACL|nr:hypothetical protein [Pullulanibacillus camelliae]GGE47484.1 hypothetical protein GCM10011391_27870 [Pullulanibacillus camelliae]
MKKTKNIIVRIEEEIRDKFYKIADKNAQNPSLLIRKWIADYINKNEEK